VFEITDRGPSALGSERRLVLLGLALAFGILLVPIALVRVPPLVDYPNHLARLWLISGGASQPPLDEIYAVDWSNAVANIGIDLLARALGPLVGAETVGRFGVALALVLPVLGAAALGRVVAGRWHAGLLTAAALAWNLPFALGFLNNQIAVGLALLMAAAFASRSWRGVVRAAGLAAAGAALMVVHPFGACFLAGLIGALGIGPSVPRPADRAIVAKRAAAGIALVLVGAVGILLLAPTPPGADPRFAASLFSFDYRAVTKAVGLLAPFLTYSLLAEGALGVVTLVVAYHGVRTGWLRVHFGLGLLAVSLFLASLVLPSDAGDTHLIDFRFAVMGLFALIAALTPARPLAGRAVLAVAVGLLAIAAARSLWITTQWQAAERDLMAVERALAPLPVGAALLSVEAAPFDAERDTRGPRLAGQWFLHTHYPLRAVVLRQAFVPGLFAFAGRQPVTVLAPWQRLAAPDAMQPSSADLARSDDPRLRAAFPHLASWRADFQYLLVLDAASPAAEPLPDGLDLVADEGFARLYRIR
jgi:hypothetical protein